MSDLRRLAERDDPNAIYGLWNERKAILALLDRVAALDKALAAERRATVERLVAMRQDWNTMPHAEFPKKWPDWKEYEVVLPTYCGCGDCALWRSGS